MNAMPNTDSVATFLARRAGQEMLDSVRRLAARAPLPIDRVTVLLGGAGALIGYASAEMMRAGLDGFEAEEFRKAATAFLIAEAAEAEREEWRIA